MIVKFETNKLFGPQIYIKAYLYKNIIPFTFPLKKKNIFDSLFYWVKERNYILIKTKSWKIFVIS